MAAEPSGRLARIVESDSDVDPLIELRRLTPVLEAINARMVLLVEDADRAGREFDIRHLERLFWTLREVERVSFVLSFDPQHARFDYAKLCDVIELVPRTDAERVLEILAMAYRHWTSNFADVDPSPDPKKNDKLRINEVRGDLLTYLRRTGRDTPVQALTELLSSPRAIKHLVRRVDHVWAHLHGEVELDDVIIVTALRYGAQPVFEFLVENIDPARHKPDDMLPRTKAIKDDWQSTLAKVPVADGAQRLVNLLGIEQLTTKTLTGAPESPQGASVGEPVDYFKRILAERIAPNELRDQTVLKDIASWKASRNGPMFSKLMAATEDDKQYVKVWEHFSTYQFSRDELLELAEGAVDAALTADGPSASMQRPVLLALWRRCNRSLPFDQHIGWLNERIAKALPISLNLANELYSYWASVPHGIVTAGGRGTVRRAVFDRAKLIFPDAQALVRSLSPQHRYALTRFVLPPPTNEPADTIAPHEWDWLMPLIISAAATDPQMIVPDIAIMLGNVDHRFSHDDDGARLNEVYTLNRERVDALGAARADEIISILATYSGEDKYAIAAKSEAQKWQAERDHARPPDAKSEGVVTESRPDEGVALE
jgi:hypothetical protein